MIPFCINKLTLASGRINFFYKPEWWLEKYTSTRVKSKIFGERRTEKCKSRSKNIFYSATNSAQYSWKAIICSGVWWCRCAVCLRCECARKTIFHTSSEGFPSSHQPSAVVDLLRPDFPSPVAQRASVVEAKLPAMRLCGCFITKARLWVCGRFAAPLFLIGFYIFTSFKVIASTTEQLKISFRRCNTHFSTAEAIQERKY